MTQRTRQLAIACAAALAWAALAGRARSQTIILDTFTGEARQPNPGQEGPWGLHERSPDKTNLPNSTWRLPSPDAGWGADLGTFKGRPCAWLNADTNLRISLASTGAYTKPAKLTVAADINLGWTSGVTEGTGIGGSGQSNFRGLGVGFYTDRGFSGLSLQADGTLYVLEDSAPYASNSEPGHKLVAELPWTADEAFDPAAWHQLEYTVDTATGAITAITLDGRNYSVKTSFFTAANTAVAGFYVNSHSGDTYGYVARFEVRGPRPPAQAP